jgi:hypothetical protein
MRPSQMRHTIQYYSYEVCIYDGVLGIGDRKWDKLGIDLQNWEAYLAA